MLIETYLNGIFPRSDMALKAGSLWLKGRETKENFDNILQNETVGLIELQKKLEFDYITDGQLLWQDFLRPIADSLKLYPYRKSADENPVVRQIFTNTFYRQPQILKKFDKPEKPFINGKFLKLIPEKKRKVILPSPFAMIYHSGGIHRNGDGTIKKDIFIELLSEFSGILNQELKSLVKNEHIDFIQFNDPDIAYDPIAQELWGFISDSIKNSISNIDAITSIHTYNGDTSKLFDKLNKLPIDRIGFDPYLTDLSKLQDVSLNKILEIGFINSKNSMIENPETIVGYINELNDNFRLKGISIVPNRPLELVPREIAIKKLESMSKSVQIIKGET